MIFFSYTGLCSFVSSFICPTNTSKTIVISESYSLCDSLIMNYLRSTRLQLCSVYVLTGPYLDALCRGAGHFVGARGYRGSERGSKGGYWTGWRGRGVRGDCYEDHNETNSSSPHAILLDVRLKLE